MNKNNVWRTEVRNYTIYKLICWGANEKVEGTYIGLTSVDLTERFSSHFQRARGPNVTLDLHKLMAMTEESDWTMEPLDYFTGTYYQARSLEDEYKSSHGPTLNMTSIAHFE